MNSDHLHRWRSIADHMNVSIETARHLARTAGLPTFKIGKTVAASKTAINEWLARQRKPEGRAA